MPADPAPMDLGIDAPCANIDEGTALAIAPLARVLVYGRAAPVPPERADASSSRTTSSWSSASLRGPSGTKRPPPQLESGTTTTPDSSL
jgi:hypothetical protein